MKQCNEIIFNTLVTDSEYFRHNWENLLLLIQIQLSKKPKKFCCFLLHFWNLHYILNILKKKEPYSLSISEIIDSKWRGYLNV